MATKIKDKFLGYGTGRRKAAVARVWIREGGEPGIQVNDRNYSDYFTREVLNIHATDPLRAVDAEDRFRIEATIKGGGMSGQAGALRLGIARALLAYDETMREPLRREGLLTRDARVKERKKYGRKKARRGFQFVKR